VHGKYVRKDVKIGARYGSAMLVARQKENFLIGSGKRILDDEPCAKSIYRILGNLE
jgi:hypothetical protein